MGSIGAPILRYAGGSRVPGPATIVAATSQRHGVGGGCGAVWVRRNLKVRFAERNFQVPPE